MATVSVVIPNLNSPVIGAVLDALGAQASLPAGLPVEVLVVGLDAPGFVAARQRPGVRLIDTGRPIPPAAARNRGASESRGGLICFLDADCVPDADWLSALLAAFATDPALQVVGGSMHFADDNYWQLSDNISTFYPYLTSSPARDCELLASFNLAVRRASWLLVGPFDERYDRPAAEDSDWSLRARRAGLRLHFTPAAAVRHQHSRSSPAALWRHAVHFGAYSTKVDPRWFPRSTRPWPLRHWLTCLAAAPVMAFAVTLRAFARDRALWRYWRTAPAVYAAKLGWCWGAAGTLRAER